MPNFAAIIERWHDFYMLVGTAAATLIGLLFASATQAACDLLIKAGDGD